MIREGLKVAGTLQSQGRLGDKRRAVLPFTHVIMLAFQTGSITLAAPDILTDVANGGTEVSRFIWKK